MAGYRMSPRLGVLLYNLVHTYVAPLLLTLIAAAKEHRTRLPFALIWFAHIAMGRALGYGLKYPESFKMTHLGSLGQNDRTT